MRRAMRRRVSIATVVASVCALVMCPAESVHAEDGDPAAYFGVDGLVFDDGALTSGGTSVPPGGVPNFPNSSVIAATDDASGDIFMGFTGAVAGVVKYEFDGVRDLSFGVDGVYTFPVSVVATVRDIAVREDGSVVIGGSFTIGGASFDPRSYAILDAAGTTALFPEPTFVLPPASPGGTEFRRSTMRTVALPDGRVLLAGMTMAGLGVRVLEPNGQEWAGFALAMPQPLSPRFLSDVAVLTDGRVLIQLDAYDSSSCRVYALNSSLQLDTSFGSSGLREFAGRCGILAAEPTGTWLYAPYANPTTVTRYLANGELVDSFVIASPVNQLEVDGSGRILIGGGSSALAFYSDFTPDPNFGNAGSAALDSDLWSSSFFVLVSGDLLFYRGSSLSGIFMQMLEDPYGLAPQPFALAMGALVPMVPDRVLDTRIGLGAPLGMAAADATLDVLIAGFGAVPADGSAIAVVLNVTSAYSTAKGFVTVWPTGGAPPTVSSLNYLSTGAATPNLVTVAIGDGGHVSLYTKAATHLIADVLGYYVSTEDPVAAGRFQLLEPKRVVDTRYGIGAPMAQVVAGGELEVQLTGKAGIPTSGVSAVAFNLTGTRSLSKGHLTVYPTGASRPTTSNLNVLAGGTRANFVIMPVSAEGKVTIFTAAGGDILVDVVGWFTDDSAELRYDGLFVPTSPRRIVDTRYGGASTRPKGSVLEKQVGSTMVGPAYGKIGAAVVNLTVVAPLQYGFISAWPTGITKPTVSSVNVGNDQANTANAAIIGLGTADAGRFQVEFQTPAHLVVDISGYYVSYTN